jgi:hypothetical protein
MPAVRKNLISALIVGAVLAISAAAISTATSYATFCPFRSGDCSIFHLFLQLDGGVTPQTLPKHDLTPIALTLSGKVSTSDGTHPSALRELMIELDKNGALNATGLPVCGKSQLETRSDSAARRACRASIVGSGTADVEIASLEAERISLPLTLFNGGVRDGPTTLFIRSSIGVPTPAPIIATVKIKKIHMGRYGLGTVTKIPPIAGGSGSLLDFNLKVKRLFTYKGTQESYAMARCFDGHLDASILSAIFKNEAKVPGVAPTTTLKGTLIRPCTSKG